VAVLGLSSSSAAGLNAEIAALGTNLLTVQSGPTLSAGTAELPTEAPAMISRLSGVYQVQYAGATDVNAYRSPLIPAVNTNALTVQASTLGLLPATGTTVARGEFLNAATARKRDSEKLPEGSPVRR
jgi:putative ABC transport system permease protein